MSESNSATVYLDHGATTPMWDEAVDAMQPYLRNDFANPSGAYRSARGVRRALDDARDEFAAIVGCAGDEVVFTSGGTESDNLAIFGAARARPGRVVTTVAEHKAVLAPAQALGARLVDVDEHCVIELGALREALDESVVLVSVMAVNNEVGVIQPIDEVACIVHEDAPDALLHCDAIQAFPYLDVARLTAPCDLVSYSAHKFGGPKGAGALVVRAPAVSKLAPEHLGGSQEHGVRSGTENVAGVIGMVTAARIWAERREAIVTRVAALRDRFVDGVVAAYPGASETAPRALRVAGNAHLRVPGLSAEELLIVLDELGVCASAGSACASGALEPSHVLIAMGLSAVEAKQALRFSLGWTTTDEEIERGVALVGAAVARLADRNS